MVEVCRPRSSLFLEEERVGGDGDDFKFDCGIEPDSIAIFDFLNF